jgi:hypothetical protein
LESWDFGVHRVDNQPQDPALVSGTAEPKTNPAYINDDLETVIYGDSDYYSSVTENLENLNEAISLIGKVLVERDDMRISLESAYSHCKESLVNQRLINVFKLYSKEYSQSINRTLYGTEEQDVVNKDFYDKAEVAKTVSLLFRNHAGRIAHSIRQQMTTQSQNEPLTEQFHEFFTKQYGVNPEVNAEEDDDCVSESSESEDVAVDSKTAALAIEEYWRGLIVDDPVFEKVIATCRNIALPREKWKPLVGETWT